jgi:hypothetical protein
MEDRFVPRDDGYFMAQGPTEWRQRKTMVIARRHDAAIFPIFCHNRLAAPKKEG